MKRAYLMVHEKRMPGELAELAELAEWVGNGKNNVEKIKPFFKSRVGGTQAAAPDVVLDVPEHCK